MTVLENRFSNVAAACVTVAATACASPMNSEYFLAFYYYVIALAVQRTNEKKKFRRFGFFRSIYYLLGALALAPWVSRVYGGCAWRMTAAVHTVYPPIYRIGTSANERNGENKRKIGESAWTLWRQYDFCCVTDGSLAYRCVRRTTVPPQTHTHIHGALPCLSSTDMAHGFRRSMRCRV